MGAIAWNRRLGDALVIGAAAGIDLMVWKGDRFLRDGQLLELWVIPALTTLIYPALLWRHRYPRAVFALHWTYALAGVVLPDYVPFAGLLVALHAVGHRASHRWACAGLVACVVPFAVNAYNVAAARVESDPVFGFVGTFVLWSALALTVWGSGRLIHATERRAEREKQEQAAAAVRAERLHLARELHDIVSHSVSAMTLQAAGARTLVSDEAKQVRVALEAIETTGVQAMGELHRLLGLLRTAAPADDPAGSRPPASLKDLDDLVSSARAAGVDVEVLVEGHPAELDRSVGLAAYRIVQEALTNTIKHAGRAASSRIHLRWQPDGLAITIRDRAGFKSRKIDELSSGHGLAGLTERVTLVGGSLEVGPVAEGFLVQAHLPTRPPTQHQTSPATQAEESP